MCRVSLRSSPAISLAAILLAVPLFSTGVHAQQAAGHIVHVLPAPPVLADWWLRVECQPITGVHRHELKLPANQGVVVVRVFDGSPADAAGIETGDVIVRVNDRSIANRFELTAIVRGSQGASLKIELLRESKPLTLTALPTTRPHAELARQTYACYSDQWTDCQAAWCYPLGCGPQFAGPSTCGPKLGCYGSAWNPNYSPAYSAWTIPIVAAPRPQFRSVSHARSLNLHRTVDLPDNMSVTLSKQGKQPVEIVVRHEDQVWEAGAAQLHTLPHEARAFLLSLCHVSPVRVFGSYALHHRYCGPDLCGPAVSPHFYPGWSPATPTPQAFGSIRDARRRPPHHRLSPPAIAGAPIAALRSLTAQIEQLRARVHELESLLAQQSQPLENRQPRDSAKPRPSIQPENKKPESKKLEDKKSDAKKPGSKKPGNRPTGKKPADKG